MSAWRKQHLALPHGIPPKDSYRRVLPRFWPEESLGRPEETLGALEAGWFPLEATLGSLSGAVFRLSGGVFQAEARLF